MNDLLVHVTPEEKKHLFFSMLRIRRVEERIEALYPEDEMKTPIHLCIGQEAVAVGVCAALEKGDYIASNHRGHGHYLAKGGDLNSMIAELYCKNTGCSKGYGGSMHLVDTSVGHIGSSSIVGGGISLATGLSLGIQMRKENRVSVAFFGDGAVDEGAFYESLNFAMLRKLPVIYVLENNQWSVCSHVSSRQIGDNLFLKASPDHLWPRKINGNEVLLVYETASVAVKRARAGEGPSLIQCDTYRISGHAGCAAHDPKGYRAPEDVEAWKEKCPVGNFRKRLLEEAVLSYDEIVSMENTISAEIDAAFAFARKSPTAVGQDLYEYLFRS